MKKVVDPQTVAHLFANQLQDEARTPGNGNLFFEGDTIYSYGRHFKIAKHVTNDKGENAILFTERSYSVSTAKHISTVRNAVHGNIISVSTLDGYGTDSVFQAWYNQGEAIAAKLKTARKPEIYLNQLNNLKYTVNRYTQFFGYEVPADLFYVLNIVNKEQFGGLEQAKKEAAEYAAERLRREKAKETDGQIIRFREFKSNTVNARGYGVDYLRFNTETNRVETSQNVQIPAEIAKRFYSIVLDTISAGGCINCDQRLLDYQVKEINKKYIVVGCHKIEIKEIKALTKKLDW